MEDVVSNPFNNPPEFLSVRTGGTVISLTTGQRRIQEIGWRDKRDLFLHPYISIEDEDMDTMEIINTAHIISVK